MILPCLPSATVRAQVRPVYSRGAAGLGHLLQRLQTTASAMHTAAHPDDEDSALIARLARGDHARIAYLSLNRGEGGQNIIGQELFEPLGIIRTEELLQARRLDGGTQLFTRVMDYGFSKTRDEAAQKWGERLTLGDMVRAIRLYRPLVIISRFTGTPADGHGHHQLAGHLTPLAFRAAADPREFPEQLAAGLHTWQARKLYVGQGFRQSAANAPTLQVDTGTLDPLTGRTFYEIAAEGRSQHKSQEMGSLELRGAQTSGVRLLQDLTGRAETSRDAGIFDGIDTSITGIARLTGVRDNLISGELEAIQQAAARALADYNALAPQRIIPHLADGLRATRQARTKLAQQLAGRSPDQREVTDGRAQPFRTSGGKAATEKSLLQDAPQPAQQTAQPATASANVNENARADADFPLAQKESEFVEALRRAANVEVDALSDAETIVSGGRARVTVRVFVPEDAPVKIGATMLRAPVGWQTQAASAPQTPPAQTFRGRNESAARTDYFDVRAPATAKPTEPYWLDEPRAGAVFRWEASDPQNEPFAAPVITSETMLEIGGVAVTLTKPVQYRYADDIRGEIRRELTVVPALSVAFDSDLLIADSKQAQQTQRIAVRVLNNAARSVNGQVRLRLPEGWTSQPATQALTLAKRGERATLFFDVRIPANTRGEDFRIGAEAIADGTTYNRTMHTVAYPHIATHRYYTDAVMQARVFDLKVAPVRVGYIMGSGDAVPDAIKRMGLDVTMLEEQDLAIGDLTRFDTIVVGIRASEVRPDFVANNARLLDYVRQGGTLIVQYQRPDYIALNLAPYPAKMASRVTDEEAPVTILAPQHPAFNFPNRITADDWRGWVQERNLYAFTEFDPRYTPLLESHDPGEDPQRGGEVYAQLGRGHYVYTSYAWFRQLPSGVPGAYRLFANLLSLSKQSPARGGARAETRR